jgi:hypothetical protein
LINLRWLKEVWRFLRVAWAVGNGLFSGLWAYMTSWTKAWSGQPQQRYQNESEGQGVPDQMQVEVIEEEEEEEDQDDAVYGRFLRQEEISDDDDDLAQGWDLGESSPESEYEDGHEEEQERELETAETVGLYTDLGATTPAPVLLAHMTRDGEFPLTRRRYGSLLSAGPEPPVAEAPVIRTLLPSVLHSFELTCFQHRQRLAHRPSHSTSPEGTASSAPAMPEKSSAGHAGGFTPYF